MRRPSGVPTITIVMGLLVFALLIMLLVGCDGDNGTRTSVIRVPVDDKTVTCVMIEDVGASDTEAAGISCNWAGMR